MDAMSQAVMELLDRQLGLARADAVLARQPGQAEHAATIKARKGEAAKRGSGAYNPVSEVAIANAPNSDVAKFLASLPISNQSSIQPRRNVPSGSMGGVSQRVSGLGSPFPMAAMPTAALSGSGSTSFEAGPSSQAGLDMASALLQQRLGAMGQNRNMDLMYRRDPRAATALIQSQMAAQEEAANRAQRGDIAGQEMDYRNRSLDMQGQMAGADRQASMERLLASLAARRGETTDQMSHAERLQQAAQIAATQEAARQREHQTGLAKTQMDFQSGEGKLSREHAARLADDQIKFQLKLKELENSGYDNRTKAELLNTLVQSQVKAAAELPPGEYEQAMARYAPIIQQYGLGGSSKAGSPVAAATPVAAPTSLTPQYPKLREELETISNDAKSFEDFVEQMFGRPAATDSPEERKTVEQYARSKYGDAAVDKWMSQEAYDGGLFGNIRKSYQDRIRKQNRRRSAVFGLEPTKIKNPYYNQGLLNAGDEFLPSY